MNFIRDQKVTAGSVTMDKGRKISMLETFRMTEQGIAKSADKNHLINNLKRHSFNETHEGYDFWERYDNTTVIKVNRKTGKIDYIDCDIDEEKEKQDEVRNNSEQLYQALQIAFVNGIERVLEAAVYIQDCNDILSVQYRYNYF